MLKPLAWSLLTLSGVAWGHGGHQHSGPAPGETIQQYAQRHMVKEHHIDSFDIRSFFHLHDLDRDKYWSKEEIEAIYGVHHAISQKQSKDEIEHQKKADHIVNTVLSILDENKDGRISIKELEKVGLEGLPNFDGMGAEGHHYDEESEFFLHHEEEFHSTPETQTDESYNHPEDLEHFAHHEKIEQAEMEREAAFQGVSVEEIAKAQLAAQEAADAAAKAAEEAPAGDADSTDPNATTASRPKVTRITPPEKQDPSIKYKDAKEEGRRGAAWGEGPEGYKPPTKPQEKMRRNVPYKYKFRRNWGDF